MIPSEIKFSDIMQKNLMERPDNPALFHLGRTLTYRQLFGLTESYEKYLLDMGIKKGDHVGIWAVNSPAWVASFLGVIKCGGVAVLFNYGLNSSDIRSLAEFTDIDILLHGTNRESIRDEEAWIKVAKAGNIPEDRCLNIEKAPILILSQEERDLINEAESQRSSKDTSVFIFTTGTTAMPKAVMLSEYAIINNAINGAESIDFKEHWKMCLALPLFHSYGLFAASLGLYKGSLVMLPAELKPQAILPMVEEFKPELFVSVGAVYLGLIAHPDFEEKMADIIRVCCIGGGFSTPSQMLSMETSFTNAKFLNGYGQTECAPIISMPLPTDSVEKRSTTVGRPMPGLEIKIDTNGLDMEGDEAIGEILVKGYNQMNGYYKLPQEEWPIDGEGWLHTGDIGYIDKEGFLTLCGRIKDIIIRAGENIAPSEIENVIIKLPEIAQVKVMGANDHILGESVQACVVLNPGVDFDEKETKKALCSSLSTIKIPENFFVYESFPLNENGKIDQRTLKSSMIFSLRKIYFAHLLDDGMRIFSMDVKSSTYNIAPVADSVSSLAKALGFPKERAMRLRLCVEEMLTERIVNAYENVGNITIDVVLMPGFLRVSFRDEGTPVDIEQNQKSSLSAKLILQMADAFSPVTTEEGRHFYVIDFLYEEGFDIEDFLAKNDIEK